MYDNYWCHSSTPSTTCGLFHSQQDKLDTVHSPSRPLSTALPHRFQIKCIKLNMVDADLFTPNRYNVCWREPSYSGQQAQGRRRCLATGATKTAVSLLSLLIMLQLRLIKTSCASDPLVHYGRHFGRTVHALCSVKSLITNGLLRVGELAHEPDDSFTWECVCLVSLTIFDLIYFHKGKGVNIKFFKAYFTWFRD
jgi:hypothetical protein